MSERRVRVREKKRVCKKERKCVRARACVISMRDCAIASKTKPLCASELEKAVGYRPATPVRVGVERFVSWYLGYRESTNRPGS